MGYDKCHVCESMSENMKRPNGGGYVLTCCLCNREYCQTHKGNHEPDDVCEINHKTYYRNHVARIKGIFPTLESKEEAMELDREKNSKVQNRSQYINGEDGQKGC
ncbi:hypothetical protein K504DRAFT_490431 [Pleomassaria siparia CBS 279.74]|uniref:Uncharacterized protein n=1 Tax=Pleomassaria siparia CBS 279.74 TaxID=1314801 RepID=A0A6G1KCU8_9PLEO|nr:hypothetical protein K504DRAFT_490431 [Pleomassaria siparia CBS 279.74]